MTVERFDRSDTVQRSYGLDDRIRMLCVGSNQRRKNLKILPAVLSHLTAAGREVELIRVGPRFPDSIRDQLIANSRVILTEKSGVAEEELIATYHRVDLLFFPSSLEGFGFPVLEAMAAGTPVVAARASSVPEIGLDTIGYFPTDDALLAADEVVRLLGDDDLRLRRIRSARIRAEELDWSRHVNCLARIYREMASGEAA